MLHIKRKAVNVSTGNETVEYFTDLEWSDHEQAHLANLELEAARDLDEEAIERMGRVFIAFLKAYAKREGVTMAQMKAAIKAEL